MQFQSSHTRGVLRPSLALLGLLVPALSLADPVLVLEAEKVKVEGADIVIDDTFTLGTNPGTQEAFLKTVGLVTKIAVSVVDGLNQKLVAVFDSGGLELHGVSLDMKAIASQNNAINFLHGDMLKFKIEFDPDSAGGTLIVRDAAGNELLSLGQNGLTHLAGGGADSGLNADLIDGYNVGNAEGGVALNNGTINTNLNADKLDGYSKENFLRSDAADVWNADQESMTLEFLADANSPLENLLFLDAGNGAVGINTTAPEGRLHIEGTGQSEQLRLSYDSSNYATLAVGSAGGTTIATATSPTQNGGGLTLEPAGNLTLNPLGDGIYPGQP